MNEGYSLMKIVSEKNKQEIVLEKNKQENRLWLNMKSFEN